ncbi:MAG: hypothetical protein EA359_17970 [Balneolaceae bacterium]|nr:MAG: hypothetical protein EA359_17970 [Balneolaceae bacterium]
MRSVIAIIAAILLVSSYDAYSQTPMTTTTIDAATYEQWSYQNWDALIETGNKALKNGIDFYYLRYRMGIAWYEKKNYRKASRHFRAAWEMNSRDDTLNEYLYYSLVFAGWDYEASALKNSFANRQKRILRLNESDFWKQIYSAYSYQSGASNTAIGRFDTSTQADGFQTISKGYHLFNLGAEHRVSDRVWLHHSYTHIQKEVFRYINTEEIQGIDSSKKFWLNQYYLGAALLLKPQTDLKIGFHYLNNLHNESTLIAGPGRPRMVSTSFTDHRFVGFISLNRRFDSFNAGITSYAGNLNNATQFQQDVSLSVFPLGNPNLYAASVFSFQSENMTDNTWRQKFIFNQTIGVKISQRIWAEASATFGDVLNFMSREGMIVNNDPDITKKQAGFRLYALLTNRMQVRLNTTFYDKESRFTATEGSTGLPENISYSTHSISATVLWNF